MCIRDRPRTRCSDVFKHANAAGSSRHGGVIALAGDDHGAKSSTLPHQSNHIFKACGLPVPDPTPVSIRESGNRTCGILVTGVGSTGLVTIGQLLGMAAHLDGKGVSVLDMARLAQKGGAATGKQVLPGP